jgi:hypothetical protein
MARPSFNNIGLRRDLNLADLANREAALDNLLNNLVTTDDGSTFDRNDLLDAIKDISNTNVSQTSIGLMQGLTVKNTVLDTETGELVDEVATPLITVKNQVDTILATTNDPPFFNGGDGLTATFYEVDQIRDETALTINSTGSQVLTGSPVVTRKFWTNGLFEFSNKLDDTLGGGNGAIQWNGYYVPDSSGPSTFSIQSTGFIIVEFANSFGDLEIKKNVYKAERTVYSEEVDLEGDQVRTTRQQAATIVTGDVLIAAYDDDGNEVTLPSDRDIVVNSAGTTVITLSESISPTGIGENWSFVFDCSDKIGTDEFSFSIVLPELEKYVPIQMRITYWYPGEDVQYFNKVLDVNLSTQLKSSGDLPYWYLYTEVGDQEVEEGFKGFYDKRLLLGGGTIGPEDVLVSSQYNKWLSLKPLILKYDPPRIYSDALRAEYRYGVVSQSNVISNSSTSPYTDNLEIGNIIISPVFPTGTFVTDISRNSIVIASELASEDNALDIVFMDHRGYLGNSFATSSGDTVTVTDTAGLLEGTVIVSENVTPSVNNNVYNYIRITEIINNRQFRTSENLNLTGSERIYYYSDKGLANRAYDNFCEGTIGAEIAITASNGDTYLTLNTVDGMAVNMVVQSAPFVPFDPDNNIITKIQEVNPAGYPANTIRITRALAHPDAKDMIAGITLVIAPGDTTLNKEACVIPLNTAPPFVGTIDGLRTTDGNGGTKDLELSGADAALNVLNLVAENVGSVVELPSSGTQSYNRKIPIKCAGTAFTILATTSGS